MQFFQGFYLDGALAADNLAAGGVDVDAGADCHCQDAKQILFHIINQLKIFESRPSSCIRRRMAGTSFSRNSARWACRMRSRASGATK